MPETTCWQCGARCSALLFCGDCGALQAPHTEYFAFFGLPQTLSLDGEELKQRFYEFSRKLHPDRFSRKSERERELSLAATAVLNDGYRTLRDPIARAEYVLKLQGLEISNQGSKDVPQELLEEVFELNMAIDEFRQGDSAGRPALEQARAHFESLRSGVDAELEELFRQYDRNPSAELLARLRTILNRRRYITNLLKEVEGILAVST